VAVIIITLLVGFAILGIALAAPNADHSRRRTRVHPPDAPSTHQEEMSVLKNQSRMFMEAGGPTMSLGENNLRLTAIILARVLALLSRRSRLEKRHLLSRPRAGNSEILSLSKVAADL